MDTHKVVFTGPRLLAPERRLRVGVLVDLELGPRAGGHVRCWERLAAAALQFPDALDLTVHFSGARAEEQQLGANVRYVVEPPVFSTARLGFLSHVPDHTDIAPWHRRLARRLARYDVIHTTDAYFAYARTALRWGRRHGVPVVNSVHTNTPEYARLFTAQTIERLWRRGAVARMLTGRLRIPERIEARMLRQLAHYQRCCAFALVSRPEQLEALRAQMNGRGALLRRGIDRRQFHPMKRDRQWLATRYRIPPERPVVICAGRLNRGKNVLFLVEAVAALLEHGIDIHLFCAGDGDDRLAIIERLGARATCPGSIAPAELARLYASADLFAFPSRIEESANVVLEALASGLPVLVTRDGGMGRVIGDGVTGLVLPGDDPAVWVEAMALLAGHPERRAMMGLAARLYAERHVPSWAEVLDRDLLPYWCDAVGRHERAAATQAA